MPTPPATQYDENGLVARPLRGLHRYRRVYTPLALSDDDGDDDGGDDDDDDDDDDPWSAVVVATDANGCFNPQVDMQEMPEQYYSKDSTGDTCVRVFDIRARKRARTHAHVHAYLHRKYDTRKHTNAHAHSRTVCVRGKYFACAAVFG
jgi:hypothetical protein